MKKLMLAAMLALGVNNAFALSCMVKAGNKYVCTEAGNSGKCPGANYVSDKSCAALGGNQLTTEVVIRYVQESIIRINY